MKKGLLILLISLSGFQAMAQDDHLEPRGTYGVYGGVLFHYFTNNMFHQLETSLDDTLVRFMSLPEFEPESSFYLKKDSEKYFIGVHRMVVNNLLGLEDKQKIVTMGLYPVEENFAKKLIALFQTALAQTKYPAVHEIDHDGTLYLFTAKDAAGRVRYAEKWSPVNGGNMTELVSICKGIIEYNKTPDPQQLDRLATRMDELIMALEKSAAENTRDQSHQDSYDLIRRMNGARDTVTSMKISKTVDIGSGALIKTEALAVEMYVKMSPGSDKLWKNIRTGDQNIEFIPDKDRAKDVYYARKRYRVLGLR